MGALQDAPQRPVFRTETNYVEVTALVTDNRGAFVPGLKLDDFELLEDGRMQRIEDFAFVDATGDRRPAAPTFGGSGDTRRPPDSATSGAEGRTYVIVLDHFHLAANQMPRVRAAVSQFIDQHLRPNDLASVVHLSASPRASVFTSSRSALLRLAGAAPGLGAPDSQSDETLISVVEDEDIAAGMKGLGAGFAVAVTERFLSALGRVIEYFGTLRVRRKTLLLFSGGIGIDLLGAAAGGSSSARDASDRAGEAMRQLVEAARRADVNIYPIDARGLSAVDPGEGVTSERTQEWGSLRVLASETGGEAVLGYNRFATAFERIANDSGRYYVLGYYTAVPNTDKKFHKLTVRVKGRPLTVRARPGFYGDATTGSRTPAADLRREGVEGLVLRPVPVAGHLGLLASASAVSRAAAGIAVQLTVELRGQDLVLGPSQEALSGNEVDVGYLGLDALGKASARGAKHVVFKVAEENWKAIGLQGWRYVTTVELAPGYHQLRVAATEAGGGRSGSVFLELEVPDLSKGPLAMGTISDRHRERGADADDRRRRGSAGGLQRPAGSRTGVSRVRCLDRLCRYLWKRANGQRVVYGHLDRPCHRRPQRLARERELSRRRCDRKPTRPRRRDSAPHTRTRAVSADRRKRADRFVSDDRLAAGGIHGSLTATRGVSFFENFMFFMLFMVRSS